MSGTCGDVRYGLDLDRTRPRDLVGVHVPVVGASEFVHHGLPVRRKRSFRHGTRR